MAGAARGVNQHCLSRPVKNKQAEKEKKKNWRPSRISSSRKERTNRNETWGVRTALPGKINPGERGKRANWATMSSARVSVWPQHLWEQVGVETENTQTQEPRCWVTNRTSHIFTQNQHLIRLQQQPVRACSDEGIKPIPLFFLLLSRLSII